MKARREGKSLPGSASGPLATFNGAATSCANHAKAPHAPEYSTCFIYVEKDCVLFWVSCLVLGVICDLVPAHGEKCGLEEREAEGSNGRKDDAPDDDPHGLPRPAHVALGEFAPHEVVVVEFIFRIEVARQ